VSYIIIITIPELSIVIEHQISIWSSQHKELEDWAMHVFRSRWWQHAL